MSYVLSILNSCNKSSPAALKVFHIPPLHRNTNSLFTINVPVGTKHYDKYKTI